MRDKDTPVILRDKVDTTRVLEPIYDSSKSFYNKAKIEVDIYGGMVLKSYDVPIMAIYKGMPFAVANNYEAGRNGVKLLDSVPDVGGFSQTTTRHTKEFLAQFTDIGRNLDTKAWNKALLQRTNERAMDVYGLRRTENGYEFGIAIDDIYGEKLAFPIEPELISKSREAAVTLFNQVMELLHQHDNPYNRALAQLYEQNRDHVLNDFLQDFERYIDRAMNDDPAIKALVEQNHQHEQVKEPSQHSEKLLEKINQEMNRSQSHDQTNDMDI